MDSHYSTGTDLVYAKKSPQQFVQQLLFAVLDLAWTSTSVRTSVAFFCTSVRTSVDEKATDVRTDVAFFCTYYLLDLDCNLVWESQ